MTCRLILVYRPRPCSKNKQTNTIFLKQFLKLVEDVLIFPGKLIIAGNFHIHVDNLVDVLPRNFMDIINFLGLTQHTIGSTHRAGHTLDLVISRAVDQLQSKLTICDSGLSDHLPIRFRVALQKPD